MASITPVPRPGDKTVLTRYRVDDANVACRVVDGEAVLLHADSTAYFGVNQTGTLLWIRLATATQTAEELSAWARGFFDDAPVDATVQIASFLSTLLERRLIEALDDSGAATPESSAPGISARDASQAAAADDKRVPWETPELEQFGELEKLILSGE